MTRLSKRLQSLADFVLKNDKVADIGCDHGYLSIYLKENKLVKEIIASDINQKALDNAIKNIKKRNLDIETVLSDGLDNIETKKLNTLIISGMGTTTILHILDNKDKLKKINKLIIQSNNDHNILRKELNNRGYYLEDEKYIYDKKKWYVTSLFVKSDKKNTSKEIEYGLLNNFHYNNYLISKEKMILKKVPFFQINIKIKKYWQLRKLKKVISDVK